MNTCESNPNFKCFEPYQDNIGFIGHIVGFVLHEQSDILDKLEENVVRLSADSFVMDDKYVGTNTVAMDYGAAGVLLTYEDEEKGLTGKNELPVAFYDFGKTLHSNYNLLQIDWHEDGIIKAE